MAAHLVTSSYLAATVCFVVCVGIFKLVLAYDQRSKKKKGKVAKPVDETQSTRIKAAAFRLERETRKDACSGVCCFQAP